MIRYLIVILFSVIPCISAFAQEPVDVLKSVLDSVGFDRSDLGYSPKGYWNRFPLDIEYKLTSFDDLFAEPLKLYDYTKTMANAVEKYMEPSFLDTNSLALYYLTYSLGIDRKLGGFRNYRANLVPVPDSAQPLESSIEMLFHEAGEFPQFADQSVKWEGAKKSINRLKNKISDTTALILGRLIINIAEVIHWRNLAFRNCDPKIMEKIYDIDSLPLTQPDGTVYYPELDDIAGCIDWPSLHYAALKTAAIVGETVDSLIKYGNNIALDYSVIETPFGKMSFNGDSDGTHDEDTSASDYLLRIDFGETDTQTNYCGGTQSIKNPLSVYIDLGGNDRYTAVSNSQQGAGILGIGIVYDVSGDDEYIGKEYSQGAGLFGVGILFDREGNDKYRAELSGQGCGYFGIGLCFDVTGDDSFYIYASGQGFGGIGGGVGVLADYEGNDSYIGEPSPEVFDLADYHSDMKINGNGVQGVGFGRRGDITDGHAWAGGLGAIIDMKGNDHYLSGNWSLGTAYWFSTGIAYDGEGDDIYESCYFTQGSGAHYCNGILVDEGGDDKHELYETAGAGLGFGWDWTNAFLINLGGNDSYRAKMISIGLAQIRSNAFLIDIGGNDKYALSEGTPGLGEASFQESFRVPSKLTPYPYYCKSIGAFIDIGGVDRYFSFTDSTETEHSRASDNSVWFAPAKGDSTYGFDNYGIGIDIDSGIIPEIEIWK